MKTIVLGLIATLTGISIIGMGAYMGMQQNQKPGHSRQNLSESTPISLSDIQKTEGIKVLFIGNSFTFYHEMPQMVVQLAKASGEKLPLLVFQETPGGWTFKQHVSKGTVFELLKSTQWTYVVLQEQSQFLSFSQQQRLQDVHLPARQLNTMIYSNHAKPILFMTWGYRDGDLMNRQSDSYPDMQNRITLGYTELATDLSATLAPVGLAWQQAIARRPDLDLWDVDGKHPNLKGSYLAACVFYRLIYHKSPVNNPFKANIDPVEAYFLQSVAASNLQGLPPLEPNQ